MDGCWMDAHKVTTAQCQALVAVTGCVTNAKRSPDCGELNAHFRSARLILKRCLLFVIRY
jgi:hypothetical protein